MVTARRLFVRVAPALLAAAFLVLASPAMWAADTYTRVNLVSDINGVADFADPNLVNPWGIVQVANTRLWIADNGKGVATLYDLNGTPVTSPIITIPAQKGVPTSTPTGVAVNTTTGFPVSNNGTTAPSALIFVTEDGTIAGWNPTVDLTNAFIKVDSSAGGSVYKGVALGTVGANTRLFVTDFHNNAVEVFDNVFNSIGSFTDSNVPAGYGPFGIANVGGLLVVTFAKQLPPDNKDDDPGPGRGFVTLFSTSGTVLGRIVDNHALNAPWGIALAPPDFGKFSNALLISNFGDGRINAFNAQTGAFLGQLADSRGPITIDGLWAIYFPPNRCGEATGIMRFTAGIADEDHGLFGAIIPD